MISCNDSLSQTYFKIGAGVADGVAIHIGVEKKIKKIVLLQEITSVFSTYDITYYKPTFFQTKIGFVLSESFTVFTGYSYAMINEDQKNNNKGFINYGCQFFFKKDKIFIKSENLFSPLSGRDICIIVGKKIAL